MKRRSKNPRRQTPKTAPPFVNRSYGLTVASTAVIFANLPGVAFCEGTVWTRCGVGSEPARRRGGRHD